MLRSKNLFKRITAATLCTCMLFSGSEILPYASAAEEDDFASEAEIKVGDSYTIHDDGPKLATFQQDGSPRNVWPMYTTASDGATIRAYCSDHSKTNPGSGKSYTVGSRVDDMRLYGVVVQSDARNTLNAFISTTGAPLTKDNFTAWMYFSASQAAVWAALGEVKIAPGNINGVSYAGSVALGYRESGKTLSASNTTEALTLYAACKMLEYGNSFNQVWGSGGKGHAPWVGTTINYCPGNSTYSAAAATTGQINFGASVAGSPIWGQKTVDGKDCYVLPMAVASATFIRGNRAFLRMDKAPSGVFLIDENGVKATQSSADSQMLSLTTKSDNSLYPNGNGMSWGATLYLCVPKDVAASLDTQGKKLELHFQSSMNVDRYNVFSAATSGNVQPVVLVEPAVWVTGATLDTVGNAKDDALVDLSVLKTDEDGAPLKGCTFEAVYTDPKNGATSKSATTDNNGEALFKDLPPKTDVTITETAAPEGYTLLPPKTVNTGTAGGQKIKVILANSDDHKFKVHKISSADGRNLMGATFEVRGIDNNYKNTFTTDALGEFYIMGRDLPTGSFEVYEVRAPEGYATDGSDIQTFLWDNSRDITLTYKNAPRPGIRIYKYEKESKAPLSDATFEIRRDGQVLQTVKTDVNGYATMYDLPKGFYQVVEVEPPAGYLKDDVVHEVYIDPTADPTNIVREVNVPNTKKLSIRIIKLDKESKVPLQGFKFDVFFNDAHLTSVTTDANGEAILENLQPGTYRVHETGGDTEHYNLDAPDQTVEIIKDQAEIPTLIFENTVKKHFGIYKIDANTHRPIQGVTFEIWRDGKSLGNYTTDESGRIWLPFAEPGTYEAQEKITDPRYVLNPEKFTIENYADYPTFIVVPNTMKKDVTLRKIDKDSGKPMEGVVFEGFLDGKSIGYFTTGADGSFTLPYAKSGTYIFKEYHTLAGYELNREPIVIEHTTDRDSDIVVDNTAQKDFVVIKRDSQSKKPLEGVQFEIWRDGLSLGHYTTDADGRITLAKAKAGTYKVQEIKTLEEYILNDEVLEIRHTTDKETVLTVENTKRPGLIIQKIDADTKKPLAHAVFKLTRANGDVIREDLISDADGKIVLEGLDTGDYTLTELTAPGGYVLDSTPRTISIKAGETYTLTIENTRKPGLLIKKLDSVSKQPLGAAVFRIARADGSVVREEATTDANGTIHLPELDSGTYIITEIRAPDGYVIDETPKTIQIRAGQTYELSFFNTKKPGLLIKKVDSTSRKPLQGAAFRITKADGSVVREEVITDENGTLHLPELDSGVYIITELRAPDGYVLDSTPKTVEIRAGETYEISFSNTKKSGLLIKKVDSASHEPLQGATFKITRSDGSVVKESATTDVNGIISLPELDTGTYIITETRAPDGYVVDETPKTVEIRAGQIYEITFSNTRKSGFTITKFDEDTRKPLKNAVFSISKANGEIVRDRVETDGNGMITLNGLAADTYIVTEIKAPDGYILQDAPKTIQVEDGGSYELTFTNKRAYGLQIRKTVKGTGQPLDGCRFTVDKASGERIGTFTTDSSGIATVTGLADGIYVVAEVYAPDGFKLDPTPQNVTVKAGELATVEFENEHLAGIRIKKIDAVTKKGIYGVRFLIKDEGNRVVGEYTTDQDGYIELEDELSEGKYKVEEISVPSGYVLDPTVRTLRVKKGETTELVIENTPVLGQIQIVKKSAQDNPVSNTPKGSLLAGAVFEITDAETGRVVDTVTSDARGIAATNPIPLGRYFVQEVQAPRFYQLNPEKVEVRLKVEGDVVRIEMFNDAANIKTTITKQGNYVVDAGDNMRYDFTNIGNASTVPLDNFFWHDRIPTDAVRAATITTGTYNARVWYSITYKTNLNGYRTLADNLLSTNRYSFKIDAGSLRLAQNEYVTDIRYEFGTVPAGFKMTEKATLLVYVPAYMKNGYSIINRADAGGQYQGEWDSASSTWVTTIYRGPTYTQPTLPKTGY